MQIVDTKTSEVVEFEPGLKVELDFVTDCVTRIVTKGVGLFKTQAHVETDVRKGIEEAIFALKSKVKP